MTENTPDDLEVNFDEEAARGIIGKHVLAGVTHFDHNNEVTSIYQFHGDIVRASLEEGIILRQNDSGEEIGLPPDLSNLKPATPGDYRLKGTGEVVVNPDFISIWEVHPPDES